MELEEMKHVWAEMSAQIEKQKKLTDKLIVDMTQEKYKSRLNKIGTFELTGSVVCVLMSLLVLANFDKYDTGYIRAFAIISAILLVLMPMLSINAINKMSNLNIIDNDYKEMLKQYADLRNKFLQVQKLSYFMGFLLLITILPVMVKILGGKDLTVQSSVWFWYLPFGILFFGLFSRWVFGYYVRTTIKLENLLKELEE